MRMDQKASQGFSWWNLEPIPPQASAQHRQIARIHAHGIEEATKTHRASSSKTPKAWSSSNARTTVSAGGAASHSKAIRLSNTQRLELQHCTRQLTALHLWHLIR